MAFRNSLHVLLAIIAGLSVLYGVEAEKPVRLGLAIFATIGWLWVSEAVNISVTALLVPVLAVVSGIFPVKEALASFSSPIIFLFMGGFALSAALQKHGLDRVFAVKIISLAGGRPMRVILLLFLGTAILSMWISNTAAVAMMLPLALGLLADRKPHEAPKLYLFVLLGLAYSGNLGGIATLIGSPPNAIAAAQMGLSFQDWLAWGVPMFLLLFPAMIVILYLMIRPEFGESLTLAVQPQPMNPARRKVIIIFSLTVIGWLFSAHFSDMLGIASGFDSLVAVSAILLLTGSGVLAFGEFVEKTRWGILILFGGGLTLSALLQASGSSLWLAEAISSRLPADNAWLVLLLVCLFVIFLTELVSNTASAALLVPLFVGVAAEIGLPMLGIAVMIALSASCAFMLPVATPPNAIVFSSNYISQKIMMKIGLVLNLSFALLIATITWWLFD